MIWILSWIMPLVQDRSLYLLASSQARYHCATARRGYLDTINYTFARCLSSTILMCRKYEMCEFMRIYFPVLRHWIQHISSIEKQKGLTTSGLHRQLHPFVSKQTIILYQFALFRVCQFLLSKVTNHIPIVGRGITISQWFWDICNIFNVTSEFKHMYYDKMI